jgi:hypothetical protein
MPTFPLRLDATGAAPVDLIVALAGLDLFADPPNQLELDDASVDPLDLEDHRAGALSGWLAAFTEAEHAEALWEWYITRDDEDDVGTRLPFDECPQLNRAAEEISANLPDRFETMSEVVSLLERLPFSSCLLGRTFAEGWCGAPECTCADHILGVALRGGSLRVPGLGELVSRRWLEHGPWRVIRRPSADLLIAQLYDPTTTAAVAWAQAADGYEAMKNGVLDVFYEVTTPIRGAVGPDGTLEIAVPRGTELTPREMADACALRIRHEVTEPSDLDCTEAAFVFETEPDARRWLHALWLRELQCWVADEHGKRRLDLDHAPAVVMP